VPQQEIAAWQGVKGIYMPGARQQHRWLDMIGWAVVFLHPDRRASVTARMRIVHRSKGRLTAMSSPDTATAPTYLRLQASSSASGTGRRPRLIMFLMLTAFDSPRHLQRFSASRSRRPPTTPSAAWTLIGLWVFAIFWHFTTGEWKPVHSDARRKSMAMMKYYLTRHFHQRAPPLPR
jgi:hypothetical protein